MKLTDYASNVYSQYGEDGMIEEILNRIEVGPGVCVEFGASEGLACSNTAKLWRHEDWEAILIEANVSLIPLLNSNTEGHNCHVGYDTVTPSNVDSLIGRKEVDLISIDVDGDDFWIFCSMFSTVLIYLYIFAFLRKKAFSSNDRSKSPHVHGATPLMVLYPLIYTVCTAPLAAGRIYALAGHDVSLGYFCAAGTMIACNGWLDVLLYASTRADIVFSELPPGDDTGLETFAFMGRGHRLGTTTTIVAAGSSQNRSVSRAASRSASRAARRRGLKR